MKCEIFEKNLTFFFQKSQLNFQCAQVPYFAVVIFERSGPFLNQLCIFIAQIKYAFSNAV